MVARSAKNSENNGESLLQFVHRDQLIYLMSAGLRKKLSKHCLSERSGWRAPSDLQLRSVVILSTTPSYQCCRMHPEVENAYVVTAASKKSFRYVLFESGDSL